ncbi:HD domain-containing protein [Patescibacteria group bacterium]|nr:HD domain-containing protein [Patescibacteria group bacterium]
MKASTLAIELLSNVGTRVEHSRAVAHQATFILPILNAPWNSTILDAAWLHDIGYSPSVISTGFHHLDGARWLKSHGWPTEVCRLVAWHTRAGTEAKLRHLITKLSTEFPQPPDMVQAALTWADLTSSPTGNLCEAENRIAEILKRYSPKTVVHKAISVNTRSLLMDVKLIKTKLNTV